MPKPEAGWAVINTRHSRKGFFYKDGVSPTRALAIARHVWFYDRELHRAGYPQPSYGRFKLTEHQKRVWDTCRQRGDKAVPVKIDLAERIED